MKKLGKIALALVALVSVFLIALWFTKTAVRIENLELQLEQLKLQYEIDSAKVKYLTAVNTKRQHTLEKAFENSEGFRLTLDQIKSYNASVKTLWVSVPNENKNSIGGE